MSHRFAVFGCFRGGGTQRALTGSVILCRSREARVLTSSNSVGILVAQSIVEKGKMMGPKHGEGLA